MTADPTTKPNSHVVAQLVAKEGGISVADLKGTDRSARISRLRALAMYIAINYLDARTDAVAAVLNIADRSVAKGVKRTEAALLHDAELQAIRDRVFAGLDAWKLPQPRLVRDYYRRPDRAGRVPVASRVEPTPVEVSERERKARAFGRRVRGGVA